MSKLGKIVRGVLFFQTALFLFKGVAYWVPLAGIPGVGEGNAVSRRAAAMDWGFAVLLFLAGRRLREEPRWIHPVLAMVLLNWLASVYEIFVRGDRGFIPPLVAESVLGALYTVYAISLARRDQRGHAEFSSTTR